MGNLKTKVINLFSINLTEEEIEVLKLGLSFTPTPSPNIPELEEDIFNFTRKLRLTYHFRNTKEKEYTTSLISNKSKWTPNTRENTELDNIIRQLNDLPLKTKKTTDNIRKLRPALKKVLNRTKENELIIKKADKGSIVVIMDNKYYWEMCRNHLSDQKLYLNLGINDPTEKVEIRMNSFAKKYKNTLTEKEHQCLQSGRNKMANFYMLPKIHKSK